MHSSRLFFRLTATIRYKMLTFQNKRSIRSAYDVLLGLFLLYQLTVRPYYQQAPKTQWAQDWEDRASDFIQGLPSFLKWALDHRHTDQAVCPLGMGLGVAYCAYLAYNAYLDDKADKTLLLPRFILGIVGMLLIFLNPLVVTRIGAILLLEVVITLGLFASNKDSTWLNTVAPILELMAIFGMIIYAPLSR